MHELIIIIDAKHDWPFLDLSIYVKVWVADFVMRST